VEGERLSAITEGKLFPKEKEGKEGGIVREWGDAQRKGEAAAL